MEEFLLRERSEERISYSVFKRITVERGEEKKREVIVGGMRHGL